MDDSRRRPRRAGDPAADALRLRQPRPHRRAARSGGPEAQPLPGRRRGGARRARRAWAEDRRHRRQRLFLGRAGDHDGRFDRAPRRPRLPGPRRRRMGRDCDAGDDRGAPLAGRRRGAVSAPAARFAGPFEALAALAEASAPTLGRSADRLHRDAETAIGHIAASVGVAGGDDRSICVSAEPGRSERRTPIGRAGPWC